jgi:hypothetical protein
VQRTPEADSASHYTVDVEENEEQLAISHVILLSILCNYSLARYRHGSLFVLSCSISIND